MRRRAGNFTSAVSILRPARSPLTAVASAIIKTTRFILYMPSSRLALSSRFPRLRQTLRHDDFRGNTKGGDDLDIHQLPARSRKELPQVQRPTAPNQRMPARMYGR